MYKKFNDSLTQTKLKLKQAAKNITSQNIVVNCVINVDFTL